MEPTPELAYKLRRSTILIRTSLGLMIFVMFLMLVGLILQIASVQNQLISAVKQLETDGANNHDTTRQYIRCIGDVLLEPINQRKPSDFDKCGVTGTAPAAQVQPSSTPQPSPAAPAAPQPSPAPHVAPSPSPAPKPAPAPPTPAPNKSSTPVLSCQVGLLGLCIVQ